MDVLLRAGLAVILAGVIGWERELHGRPAGVRTHMLVALGTVLFTEVGMKFGAGTDPSRVAAQVVTGIGFLGAGTIMRMGGEVKGLTTAASVWATAGIAMAVSIGGSSLIVAIIATGLVLATLGLVDNLVRKHIRNPRHHRLEVTITERAGVHDVIEALTEAGLLIESVQLVSSEPDLTLAIKVEGPDTEVLKALAELPRIRSARWEE